MDYPVNDLCIFAVNGWLLMCSKCFFSGFLTCIKTCWGASSTFGDTKAHLVSFHLSNTANWDTNHFLWANMACCKAECDNVSLGKHRGGWMGTPCPAIWLNTSHSTNGADRASRRLLSVEWRGMAELLSAQWNIWSKCLLNTHFKRLGELIMHSGVVRVSAMLDVQRLIFKNL